MILGLIPARLNSARLPNKALLKIDGLPMIIHVLKRAQLSKKLDKIIVCTDSEKIIELVKEYKGQVMLTSSKHNNGTERISEVSKKMKCKQVIDIQCDEILLNPKDLDDLIDFHKNNKHFDIVVPHSKIINKTDKNVVKIVSNSFNKVLYMSRENLPFSFKNQKLLYSRHLDIISFKPEALTRFSTLSKSYNEQSENIELLRALDNNFNVGTFLIKNKTFSVNTSLDFLKAKKLMKYCKIRKRY
jgi:3-deoxy-manno-octulosonate cytidylyltransferase (CMP-KDO synthetase)